MIPYARRGKKGYRYMLTIIDVFFKYAWAIPVKRKTAKDVTQAMAMVLRGHRLPKHLQTDQGKEFININFQKLLKRYGIKHYSTFSTLKASVVERFNHTLKDSMWREFSFILQKIISVFFPPTLFLGSFKVQSHYLFTI